MHTLKTTEVYQATLIPFILSFSVSLLLLQQWQSMQSECGNARWEVSKREEQDAVFQGWNVHNTMGEQRLVIQGWRECEVHGGWGGGYFNCHNEHGFTCRCKWILYAWKLLTIELSLCFNTLFHLSTPSKGVKGFSPRAAQDRCTRMSNRLTIEDFHGGLFEHRT